MRSTTDVIPSRRHDAAASRARGLLAGALFGVSAGTYVAASLLLGQPFHVGLRRLVFFDLHVYRNAADAVLRGGPLYRLRLYRGMRFTYPPFAALVLLPTRLVGIGADAALSWALNLVLLVVLVRVTLGLCASRARDGAGARGAWTVALPVAAVALWCEPVTVTLGYGQIDLAIALLIVGDLARPRDAPGRGVGIGLAAAVKLTPLLFIPYLLLSRERRAAITATVAFLAAGAVGWAALPADSARYWGGAFLQSRRTGNVADLTNQSLLGAADRLTHSHHPGLLWVLVVVAVGITGLWVAGRAARRGDAEVGFAVCAITSLLVSPVSWTHHWVLALPAVLALAVWAWRRRAWSLAGTLALLALVMFAYVPELVRDSWGLRLTGGAQILAEPYVLLGLAVVVCAGVAGRRGGVRERPPHGLRISEIALRRSLNGRASAAASPRRSSPSPP